MSMLLDLRDNWQRADEWQKHQRDIYLPQFYGKYALQGRYVFIDKSDCSTILQKRLAIDTVFASIKTGGSICVEEKIVQWPGFRYRRFFLETRSCTVKGHESPGWMHYAQADYLLYAFEQEDRHSLEAYFINFPELRTWFWESYEQYELRVLEDTSNHTEGRLVDIQDVVRNVHSSRYIITPERCIYIPYRTMKGKK